MLGTHCTPEVHSTHLYDELYVLCEGLDAVEAGDEAEGDPALLVHVTAQEVVSLQVVSAEVVLSGTTTTCHTLYNDHNMSYSL